MTRPGSNETLRPRIWRRRKSLLVAIVTLAIVGSFGIFYAWEYRTQVLLDETASIKETYIRQLNFNVFFGNRGMGVTVETYKIPVYVTLWWQSGTNAFVYLQDQPVAVNSTWTTSVTLHNSGGHYWFLVAKSEAFGEGLTTIHVRVTV